MCLRAGMQCRAVRSARILSTGKVSPVTCMLALNQTGDVLRRGWVRVLLRGVMFSVAGPPDALAARERIGFGVGLFRFLSRLRGGGSVVPRGRCVCPAKVCRAAGRSPNARGPSELAWRALIVKEGLVADFDGPGKVAHLAPARIALSLVRFVEAVGIALCLTCNETIAQNQIDLFTRIACGCVCERACSAERSGRRAS